jgi:ComF family protein
VCAERYALTGAWCVGERRSVLLSTLDAYKFERVKAAATVFARLLHETVPVIGPDYVVATIPTASQHIRVRGYDHAELIAKEFAKLRGLPYQRLLNRETSVTQHFSSRRERFAHAKSAFKLRRTAPKVFLFDDIITTGATIQAATELLRAGGVEEVYVGVIARQPLDGSSDL